MQHPNSTFILASSVVTPLGCSVEENFNHLIHGNSGVKIINDTRFFDTPIPLAKIDEDIVHQANKTFDTQLRFDSILLKCISQLKEQTSIDLSNQDVLVILSTTKGNIEVLNNSDSDKRVDLSFSANLIQQFLNQENKVQVVSNACISGLSAIIIAKRYLKASAYKYIVVVGCDVLSKFVISGFNSFHAISSSTCKPFDLHRKGISLGEACAAVLLSNEIKSDISIESGAISNDANHISGPSKTGEELAFCIETTLKKGNVNKSQIDFISAHGTATEYNDEMESKAFSIQGLHSAPVFSVKGIYGHTLGASGVLETIIAAECLKRNVIIPSWGFDEKGVSGDIMVNQTIIEKPLQFALKTASGFGGCNAAILLKSN